MAFGHCLKFGTLCCERWRPQCNSRPIPAPHCNNCSFCPGNFFSHRINFGLTHLITYRFLSSVKFRGPIADVLNWTSSTSMYAPLNRVTRVARHFFLFLTFFLSLLLALCSTLASFALSLRASSTSCVVGSIPDGPSSQNKKNNFQACRVSNTEFPFFDLFFN